MCRVWKSTGISGMSVNINVLYRDIYMLYAGILACCMLGYLHVVCRNTYMCQDVVCLDTCMLYVGILTCCMSGYLHAVCEDTYMLYVEILTCARTLYVGVLACCSPGYLLAVCEDTYMLYAGILTCCMPWYLHVVGWDTYSSGRLSVVYQRLMPGVNLEIYILQI